MTRQPSALRTPLARRVNHTLERLAICGSRACVRPRRLLHYLSQPRRRTQTARGALRAAIEHQCCIMLGHWHAQQRNIRSARDKRFLGIIGIGHNNVVAQVQWGAFLGCGVRRLHLLPSARDSAGGDRYGALPTFR